MNFDPSTARPVSTKRAAFDPSTAQPVKAKKPGIGQRTLDYLDRAGDRSFPQFSKAVEGLTEPYSDNYMARQGQMAWRGAQVPLGVAADVGTAARRGLGAAFGVDTEEQIGKLASVPVVGAGLAAGVDMLTDPTTYAGLGAGRKLLAKGAAMGDDALRASQKIGQYGKQLTGELAREAGKTTAAQKVGQALAKPLMNQRGAVEIPDIDDLAKQFSQPQVGGLKSPGQIRKAAPKAPKLPIGSRIEPGAALLMSEPETVRDVPLSVFAEQARKSQMNRFRNTSTMDLAGIYAGKAHDDLRRELQGWGQKKGAFMTEHGQKPVDLKSVPTQFKSLAERLGYTVDDAGKVVELPGRIGRKGSERDVLQGMMNEIGKVREGSTAQMADDLKAALAETIKEAKTRRKELPKVSDGIRAEIYRAIDDEIVKSVGGKYREINNAYTSLIKMDDGMSRALGGLVDETGEVSSRGASIMKRAVQSNTGAEARALFEGVKRVTGVDLIKIAGYAEITGAAVNDPKVMNLLAEVGSINKRLAPDIGGKIGLAAKAAGKAMDVKRGDKLDEVVKYYNSVQKRQMRKNPEYMKLWLERERMAGATGKTR
jgi:hypothetical protein